MSRFFRSVLALPFLFPLIAVPGQNATQRQPDTDRQIILDVQVTEKSGAPARGLQEDSFALLDDRQLQKIVSFHALDVAADAISDPPVEVVLLVDAINAPHRAVAYERDEVKKFLLQNGGKLPRPVSLVVFSEAGADVQNGASRDGIALAALLDQSKYGLRSANRYRGGFQGAVERSNLSLKTLTSLAAYEATRPGRKLVIWLSPGWPFLSGPRVLLSPQDRQWIFDAIVSASAELSRARITLYAIDPLGLADAGGTRTSYYQEFLKGVLSPAQVVRGDLSLQVLAVQSGGRVIHSKNDLTAAIRDCVADADSFYVLSFNSRPAARANEYHSLQITVDKPGMTARARTGYYDQP